MPPPFSARSVTLRQLLCGEFRLSIPDYQRAYAWTTTQAGQLLEDLLVALDEAGGAGGTGDDDYFLGAVVLMAPDGEPGQGTGRNGTALAPRQDVVDGLQRIVTLTILFAVLRDLLAEDAPDAAALAASCIACAAAGQSAGGETATRIQLSGEAQVFFQAFVQSSNATSAMPDDDNLAEALNRMLAVREHLMSILVGEGIERLEALISFLLDHCHCAVISTRTLDRAHRIFSVLNDRGRPLARGDILKAQVLGSAPVSRRPTIAESWAQAERRLGGSLDELLSHIRTIEGRSRHRIIDDIRALIERSGSAEAFVESSLVPYSGILEAIREPRKRAAALTEDIAARLDYLGWLGSGDWLPPLMLHWRLVDGAPPALGPFLVRLDRLAYGLRLLGVGGDRRLRRYAALLDAVRAKTLDAPGNPLDLTRDEQRLIAYNLRNLHARSQIACKLLLLRLNDVMAGAPQHLDPADYTVEHVLPQKPPRNSRWREWFETAEQREASTASLGNLILVSRDRNEKARNLELDRKLEIYFADGVEQPLISRDIQGLETWRPEDVRRREERLVVLVGRIWKIGSEAESGGGAMDDEAA